MFRSAISASIVLWSGFALANGVVPSWLTQGVPVPQQVLYTNASTSADVTYQWTVPTTISGPIYIDASAAGGGGGSGQTGGSAGGGDACGVMAAAMVSGGKTAQALNYTTDVLPGLTAINAMIS